MNAMRFYGYENNNQSKHHHHLEPNNCINVMIRLFAIYVKEKGCFLFSMKLIKHSMEMYNESRDSIFNRISI